MNHDSLIERNTSSIPSDYGNPLEEYDAIESSAGIIRLPDSSVLSLRGKNAEQFLNGLVSNDVKSLEPGQGTLAAFLDVAGKVQALTRIYKAQDGDSTEFLLELESVNAAKTLRNLSRFVLAGEFFVDDLTNSLSIISIQGPKSASLIAELCGEELPDERYSHKMILVRGTPVRIARNARCANSGIDIFAPADQASKVWDALLDASARSRLGAMPIGRTVFDMARIEAGIPREPEDITPENILNETGLESAISYTKGCYLGQEIVARIHWRGQPARRLCGLALETIVDSEVPPVATELFSPEDRKVGRLTSITQSFGLNRTIALGYVHKYHITPGTRLTLKSDEQAVGTAEVVALPFIKRQEGLQ